MRTIRIGGMVGLLLLLVPVVPGEVRGQAPSAGDTLAVQPASWVDGVGRSPLDASMDDDPPFDLAVARRVRAAGVQRSPFARGLADVAGFAAIPGSPLLAAGLYGVGELDDRENLREVGLQTGQAIVVAGGVAVLGKLALGRARPHASPDDPYRVRLGGGLGGDDYQSFPSAHTAAAFASAFVLSDEISERHPGSAIWIIPTTFGAATLAGFSRVFQDQHWLSDIVAGAVVGSLSGWAVTELHEN